MQQTPCGLSPWADGRGNVGNRVAVVMIPVRPGTLTTPTRVTQHTPTFAQGLSPQGIGGTTPGGCQQTPNASTTEAPGQSLSSLGAWHQKDEPQHRFFGLTVWAWLATA